MSEEAQKGLTAREKAWADAYILTLNKAEAARRARYKGDNVQLATIGWQNYRKPYIKVYLKDKLEAMVMSADEVLARLAGMAQSSIEDYIDILPGGRMILTNFEQAKNAGVLHLIKKLKITKEGPEIELYDAQAALVHIGKAHGLFKETTTNLNLDLSQLTNEQLQRIAAGEDPIHVASSTQSGG